MEIYQYLSATDFLQDIFKAKKKAFPSYSIRSWARQLGFSSHSTLQRIVSEGMVVPLKLLPLLISALRLSSSEALYLEVLLNYENSKSLKAKEEYYQKLIELRSSQGDHFLEIERRKYLQEPLHNMILCLKNQKNYKHDPKWIKRQLRYKVSLAQIIESLERIELLGLTVAETEVSTSYHLSIGQLAIQELKSKNPSDTVDCESVTFNIREGNLTEATLRLEKLMQNFVEEFQGEPGTSNCGHNLNLQLFSITKTPILLKN